MARSQRARRGAVDGGAGRAEREPERGVLAEAREAADRSSTARSGRARAAGGTGARRPAIAARAARRAARAQRRAPAAQASAARAEAGAPAVAASVRAAERRTSGHGAALGSVWARLAARCGSPSSPTTRPARADARRASPLRCARPATEVGPSTTSSDAAGRLRDRRHADRIVVAGGDGSIGPAALRSPPSAGLPLAVVPTGTANDFARALGAAARPRRGLRAGRDADGRDAPVDLARAGERPFVNAASAGLSVARRARGAPAQAALGPLAYAVGALRAGLTAHAAALPRRSRRRAAVRGHGLAGHRRRHRRVRRRQRGRAADAGDGLLDVAVVAGAARAPGSCAAPGACARGGLVEQAGRAPRARRASIEVHGDEIEAVQRRRRGLHAAPGALRDGPRARARGGGVRRRGSTEPLAGRRMGLAAGSPSRRLVRVATRLRHRREQGARLRAARRGARRRLEPSSCAPPRRSRARRSRRQRGRAADQRRPRSSRRSWRRSASAKQTVNLLTYVYWQGDIAREVAGAAVRARAARASRSTSCWTRSAAAKMDRKLIDEMRDAGVVRRALPPAEALRAAPPEQPHAPQAADRRRAGRDDRRRRDRRGVDRQRPGPRPLARHPRARPRAGRARPAGRVRRELARGDRRRARRRGVPARARASRRRRPDAARALARRASATRTSRRCTSWPSPRRAQRSTSRRRTSPRARRSSRRCATRRERGVDVRVLVPGPHIDKEFVRVAGRARLRAAAGLRRARSASTGRRCCTPRRSSSTAPGRRSAR